MREEVLNQHFRERRPASRPAAAAPTEINDDFLNALPPDIRAEVLQQEAIETSRRAREAAARAQREGDQAAGAPAVQPADIDPASFLASLDPELRNDVMMEQDDEFLQSLPGGLLAGLGGGYRSAPEGGSILAGLQPPSGGARRSENRGSRGVTGASGSGGEAAVPAKKPVARDAIQLLDKTGIASLVRLLFFPEVSRKSIVPRVLVNLCENSKTRAELLDLLLTVVQDGTGDLSAVDKSFAQMNIRGGKTNTPKTATPKKKAPDTPGPAALFSHLSAESIPTFIAQRCFDALSQIVQSIDRASFFFLTEHDVLVGLKRAAAKKGKGKERQILQTKYPLVVLLGLLDRPALLKNSSMMDSLTALLVLITKPLTTLPPPPPSDGPKDTSLMGILGIPPTSISSSTAAPPPTPSPATAAENALSADQATSSEEQPEAKATVEDSSTVLSRPPQVPNNVLRLVVNILTHGECSSATFKSALTLIHHLSFIPDAKEIITAELRSQAQEFGNALQVDLQELSGALKQAEETTRAVTIAKFTPASSTQAKLLRCLKADEFIFKPASADASRSGGEYLTFPIPCFANQYYCTDPSLSFLFFPVAAASAASPPVAVSPGVEGASSIDPVATVTPEEDLAHSVFSSFSFGPLWSSLSECLAIVEENDSLSDVATVLLPVVESLMVVSRYTLSKAARSTAAAAAQGSLSPKSPSSSEQPSSAISTLSDDIFVKFTDNHRKILNTIIRANPALMSGSFALLVENPRVLDFTNKRAYFAQQLRRRPNKEAPHTLQVNVRRQQIFEDSFSKFMRWTPEQIKYGKLNCRFWDEPGIDAGGVSREWFSSVPESSLSSR
jgi:E3 ubiquitin-protein ligase HUWE1